MSVTTKTGDKGITSLYWGGRTPKDDLRVQAYGGLDELCSFLGLSRSLIKNRKNKQLLESIQRELFILGAEIATKNKFLPKLGKRINKTHIIKLEKEIEAIERKNVFEECCFYLPGENLISAALDVSRTVARRVERQVVSLNRKKLLKNPSLLIYLNRLSDLLYLLARVHEKKHRKVKFSS